MATSSVSKAKAETLRTLPGDDVRQIMWRFADRYDLQMLVQSTRDVARGLVARLVAGGARASHDWTPEKNELLEAYDKAGITAAFMEPEQGGFIVGPKNLALALIAYELAWVDAGAATGSLAGCLALSPIHERGTQEQRDKYMALCAPAQPGEDRKPWRGAFCLTEPIPYVGVDTGMLAGKVRVADWREGEEPVLHVEKRGRFITNMGFANFVTAAVDTDDPKIKGSCIVIVEEGDEGVYDRGTPAKKLVHQLSSTNDPIFNVEIPASRIVGGYTVKDGAIVPNYDHSEVIEAVFKRTRVTVAVMTSAKLLSAIEPVIRYQRGRFRGAEQTTPGTLRYELGIQQRQDALHRLAGVWSMGEAGASLAFAAARLFDELDPKEREKDSIFAERGIGGGRAAMKAYKEITKDTLEYIELARTSENKRDNARFEALQNDPLVQFKLLESVGNVICPAAKLWNTGNGSVAMREAVALMGGYGITEDCPGFLGYKWMDSQLEATYEGPEAVQRRNLTVTMTDEVFLEQFKGWISEMRAIAGRRPGTGACTLASAMKLWLWTYNYLQNGKDADGKPLYHGSRQGVTFPLADALGWLLAARYQILDAIELETKGPENPVVAEGLEGTVQFFTDLCHMQAARTAGEVSRICSELVYGFQRHPAWDDPNFAGCFKAEDLDSLEGLIPGIASCATDVIETTGAHPPKEGPCAGCSGLQEFVYLRMKLDSCLTGAMLAKDRAAEAIAKVMIPEALDYPRQ
ncbi:MAG TPA: acyl-CoA dehydrogenase family protein [Terriglobales bacterium]|nr:acyl-CoA dehydrogenase family protein [Terriglobales bacterium]